VRRFLTWVRVNSQHHLLRAAQADVARRAGYQPPPRTGSFFWTRLFPPVYRATPWAVRKRVMAAMPGSHRRSWPTQTPPAGPAV
jgi:hypothetical protein